MLKPGLKTPFPKDIYLENYELFDKPMVEIRTIHIPVTIKHAEKLLLHW